MENQNVKLIKLPNGSTLEVSIYPGFIEKLKNHFGLESDASVNDDHIRMYIYGAFKGAIDRQEYDKI
jgi:hypothetical protein